MVRRSALVVLSGGQDSTTCLFAALEMFPEVHAVTFDYNQRHRIEIDAARKVAELAGISHRHEVIELGPILKGKSPLTDPAAPLETYTDFESMDKTIGSRIELTFVPMRNALFLTLAWNRAVVLDCDTIVTGVCQADNANYPDCRDVFIRSMNDMVNKAMGTDLLTEEHLYSTWAPLIFKTKAQSILFALQHEGCYAALGFSHTAYDGTYPPTSQDHASTLRAEGFRQAGVPDPLVVRAFWEAKMELPKTPNYEEWMDAIVLAAAQPVYPALLYLEGKVRRTRSRKPGS